LTSKILTTFKQQVKDLKLVPGKGGCFELTADGDLIYSKLKTHEFPDEQWILDQLERKRK
jgi:selT/selW/selH-like putative selenoprotein